MFSFTKNEGDTENEEDDVPLGRIVEETQENNLTQSEAHLISHTN